MSTDLSSFSCIPMISFNTALLNATYQVLNTTGFADDIKVLKIYNDGTNAITISYDGVTDHDYYPGKTGMIIDLQTNHGDFSSSGAGTLYGRKGQQIWGKGTAGANNFYIIGYR
jgi:hypothetical protein